MIRRRPVLSRATIKALSALQTVSGGTVALRTSDCDVEPDPGPGESVWPIGNCPGTETADTWTVARRCLEEP